MNYYDPSKNIDATIWLAIDEGERLRLIEEYVSTEEDEIDDSASSIHASAHSIVENQLALDEKDTVDAFARLRRQGIGRHEAIHAIAAVIFTNLNEASRDKDKDLLIRYKSRLRKLTAKRWLKGKY
jgi:AmiR/NasT family two-component response regulator